MLSQSFILEKLRMAGAILTNGHFVYTSGNHGDVYVDKAAVTINPLLTSHLGSMLADAIAEFPVDVVVAPAVGAIALGHDVAFHLSTLGGRVVASVYAERQGNEFALRRGYDQRVRGQKVAVIEDILTTGSSAMDVIKAVKNAGGKVIVVGALCNRGGVTTEDLGIDLVSLIDISLEQYAATEDDPCPLCAKGVPINTEPGHGAEFLARQRA